MRVAQPLAVGDVEAGASSSDGHDVVGVRGRSAAAAVGVERQDGSTPAAVRSAVALGGR